MSVGCPTPDGVGRDGGIGSDGGHSDDAGALPESYPASEYCERIAPFFCSFYLRCGRMAADDQAECLSLFAEGCEGRFEPRYVALEELNLLELSPAGIEGCREHLDDVECAAQIRDLDGPCQNMWRGTQAQGAGCGFDVESFICAPGTRCVLGLDLCGDCRTIIPDGDACGDDDGATCAATSRCLDSVCTPRGAPGQPCLDDGPGCVLGARCEEELCVPPAYVGVGQGCDSTRRCAYHSDCIGGICTLSARLDESCSASGPVCDSGFCDPAASQCIELLDVGQPCSEPAQCATGRCDQTCQASSGCLDP